MRSEEEIKAKLKETQRKIELFKAAHETSYKSIGLVLLTWASHLMIEEKTLKWVLKEE